MNRHHTIRGGALVLGTLLLASSGMAMAHADEIVDENDVQITVDVADRYPSGVLALSVAADSTTLNEVDSGDPLVREFTGTLPAVTVTDTRSDTPDVPWYVLGTAGDFVSDDSTISAEHLGWSPFLAEDYGPSLEAGFDIPTVIDDPDSEGLGYADGELLYVNTDQLATYDQGAWTASADLHLKVDAASVDAGSYTSLLTLSLFE